MPSRAAAPAPPPGRPDAISLHVGSRLPLDLARLGVTITRGPADLVERVLAIAASDLADQLATRSFDLVLAGFGDAAPAGVTACPDLAAALDVVAAKAVAIRRSLDDHPDAAPAGPTVLVSRASPTPAELKLLVDLVTDPGGAAALVPVRSPHSPPGVHVLELSSDPARPDAFAATLRPRTGQAGLRIGVLGPLTINGQPAALLPAQSQLIVALALHRAGGLANKELCRLLGPDPDHPRPSDSLRQLIVRTRRQLGPAEDGREWIEHRGGGRYALHPAATLDWTDFEASTARAIAARDAEQLTVAMAMIKGQPFTGCFYWWLDLAMVEAIRARIVDVAETLAKLTLAASAPAAAARAARTGLIADESAERLWRVLMRAEHAAGNMAGVREAWTRCRNAIADIAADGQPEPATAAVYRQLGGRQATS